MDPISDMFIRIKNAQKAGHKTVQIPYSKFKHEIVKVLERTGRTAEADRKGKRTKKFLEIKLKYREDGAPLVLDVMLFSKPSRRLFSQVKAIPYAKHGGIIVLSTSKGVLSAEEARKSKVGGQLIAEVW